MSTKRGTARGIPLSRIWLEGAKLGAHGFTHALKFDIAATPGQLIITLSETGKRRVAGTPARPIIDITGETIRTTFSQERIDVEYAYGKITLRG
jgi:hypothetical protein